MVFGTSLMGATVNERKILMREKINCPYCGSGKIKERVAIRYGDYDKNYVVYRCLECGREFSEKDIENTFSPLKKDE